MKNYIIKLFVAVLLTGVSAVAAASGDAMLMFSTRGPDRYADGMPVQVGECYALVWVRNGASFAGVDLNGKAVDPVNNDILVALPRAKARKRTGAVHCPHTFFQIPDEYVNSHADGEYAVVLLDTRVANADGELVTTGDPTRVQGWGFAEKSRVRAKASQPATSKADASDGDDDGVTTDTASAIPAGLDIPTPKITGISVKDGFVILTVKGTTDLLNYNVRSGATPGNLNRHHAARRPEAGRRHREHEMTLVVPVTDSNRFFRVTRN